MNHSENPSPHGLQTTSLARTPNSLPDKAGVFLVFLQKGCPLGKSLSSTANTYQLMAIEICSCRTIRP